MNTIGFQKRVYIAMLLLAGIAILLIGSCSAPTAGVFYSVATEVRLDAKNNGIPQTVTPNHVTLYNYPSNPVYLALSGTRLVAADHSFGGISGSWQQVSTPAGNKTCIDVSVSDTAVYAIFTPDSITSPALYRTTFNSASGATGAQWTEVSLPNAADRVFGIPTPTGNKDYAIAQTVTDLTQASGLVDHYIYAISNGVSQGAISIAAPSSPVTPTPITPANPEGDVQGSYVLLGVAVDKLSGDVWAINAFDVFHTTTDSFETLSPTLTLVGAPANNGNNTAITIDSSNSVVTPPLNSSTTTTIAPEPAHRIYVATSDSNVYRTDSRSTTTAWIGGNLGGYTFSSICPANLVDQANPNIQALSLNPNTQGTATAYNNDTTILVIGTSNTKGLVICTDNGTSLSLVGNGGSQVTTDLLYYSDYSSTNMGSKSITNVFYSGIVTDPVFICVTQLGLWSATYGSSYNTGGQGFRGLNFINQ